MRRQFVFGTVMAAALTVGLGAQSSTPQSSKPYGGTSQGTTQEKSTGMHETERGHMVTLVGCLQSGDQSTSGTAGTSTGATAGGAGSTAPGGTTSSSSRSTSNRGAMGGQFVLTDATESSTGKTGAAATGTSGATAGSSAMANIPSRLQLMASGNSSANWSRYLNHRVEVTGTLSDTMGGTSSPSSTNPSSTTPSTTSPSTPPSTTPPSTTPPSTKPANPTGSEPSRSTGAGTMSSSDMGPMLHVTSIKEVSGTCSGSIK